MDNNVGMAQRYEHEIPDGYEARIEGNKVILEPKESDNERIMKDIITALSIGVACDESALYPEATITLKEAIAYLKEQKEQKPLSIEETELNSIAFLEQMGYTCIPPRKEQKPASGNSEKPNNHAEWSEGDEMHLANAILAAEKEWGINSCTAKFLKSLRPSWKPSEEQLSALKEQTSWLSKDNPLHSLYYQLCEL